LTGEQIIGDQQLLLAVESQVLPICPQLSEEISANWLQSKYLPRVAVKARSALMTGSGSGDSGWDQGSEELMLLLLLLPFHTMSAEKVRSLGTPLGHLSLAVSIPGMSGISGSSQAIKRCSKLALYCVFVCFRGKPAGKASTSRSRSPWSISVSVC